MATSRRFRPTHHLHVSHLLCFTRAAFTLNADFFFLSLYRRHISSRSAQLHICLGPPRSLHPNTFIRSHLSVYDAHQRAVIHVSVLFIAAARRGGSHDVELSVLGCMSSPQHLPLVVLQSAGLFFCVLRVPVECYMAFTHRLYCFYA